MLELRRGEASAAAVRAAYKRLALALHPDRNHARQAEAAFKRLQSAYEALRGGSGSGGGVAALASASQHLKPPEALLSRSNSEVVL